MYNGEIRVMPYDSSDWSTSGASDINITPSVNRDQRVIDVQDTSQTTEIFASGLNYTSTRMGHFNNSTSTWYTNLTGDGIFTINAEEGFFELLKSSSLFSLSSLPTSNPSNPSVTVGSDGTLWYHNGTEWLTFQPVFPPSEHSVVKNTKYSIDLTKVSKRTEVIYDLTLDVADNPSFKIYNGLTLLGTLNVATPSNITKVYGHMVIDVVGSKLMITANYTYEKSGTPYLETQNAVINSAIATDIEFGADASANYTASTVKIINK